jgi:hypothetical protein
VLFTLLKKTLIDDFFKGKIHMNPSKDPPSNEFNEVIKEWISRSTDRNPLMGRISFESHYKVNLFLELDNLKDAMDDSSRNVDILSNKFGKIFMFFLLQIF